MLSDVALSLLRFFLSPFPETFQERILRLGIRDTVFLGTAAAVITLFLATLFLAGFAFLLRARRERSERDRARFEALVRPHILRVLSGETTPADVQHLVPESREVDFLRLLLAYEDRLRGKERELIHAIAHPHLDAARREILDPVPERRALAIRALGVLGLPETEKSLLDALDDPVAEVALVAAHALAERGGARYGIPILAHLHRFERWSPRYLAEMLATMGGEIVPDLSLLALDENRPAKVRAIAADAMRLIGYPEAADTAAQILEQGEVSRWRGERETRIAALRILSVLGRPEHLPLIRRLSQDPDPVIREVSITALGALGTREDLPYLVEEMNGPSHWVALEAARSIRALQEVGEADGEVQVTPDRVPLFREVLGA